MRTADSGAVVAPPAPVPVFDPNSATTQAQIAASNAANPNAAGAGGTYFAGNASPVGVAAYQPSYVAPAAAPPPAPVVPPTPVAAPAPPPVGTTVTGPTTAGSGPPAVGTGGAPASFDYSAAVAGDPGYLALQAALGAADTTDLANIASRTSSALINFGRVPTGLPGSIPVSAADAAIATNNPYSTEAELKRQHDIQLRVMQNQLAARGGYNSGELSYGLQQEGLRYGGAESKAAGAVVDYLNNLQSQYAAAVAARDLAKANGLSEAYARAYQLYGGQIGTGQTSTLVTPTDTAPAPLPADVGASGAGAVVPTLATVDTTSPAVVDASAAPAAASTVPPALTTAAMVSQAELDAKRAAAAAQGYYTAGF